MRVIKLPKSELAEAQVRAVQDYLQRDLRPIWENCALVSCLPLDAVLEEGLKSTLRTGCFSQGLESIEKILHDEKKGLVAVQSRTGQKPADRMSRLLLVSKDGAERFYRQVGSLLAAHGNRVWAIKVDADSQRLGETLARGPAKAILINDKKALASFLTALARNLL